MGAHASLPAGLGAQEHGAVVAELAAAIEATYLDALQAAQRAAGARSTATGAVPGAVAAGRVSSDELFGMVLDRVLSKHPNLLPAVHIVAGGRRAPHALHRAAEPAHDKTLASSSDSWRAGERVPPKSKPGAVARAAAAGVAAALQERPIARLHPVGGESGRTDGDGKSKASGESARGTITGKVGTRSPEEIAKEAELQACLPEKRASGTSGGSARVPALDGAVARGAGSGVEAEVGPRAGESGEGMRELARAMSEKTATLGMSRSSSDRAVLLRGSSVSKGALAAQRVPATKITHKAASILGDEHLASQARNDRVAANGVTAKSLDRMGASALLPEQVKKRLGDEDLLPSQVRAMRSDAERERSERERKLKLDMDKLLAQKAPAAPGTGELAIAKFGERINTKALNILDDEDLRKLAREAVTDTMAPNTKALKILGDERVLPEKLKDRVGEAMTTAQLAQMRKTEALEKEEHAKKLRRDMDALLAAKPGDEQLQVTTTPTSRNVKKIIQLQGDAAVLPEKLQKCLGDNMSLAQRKAMMLADQKGHDSAASHVNLFRSKATETLSRPMTASAAFARVRAVRAFTALLGSPAADEAQDSACRSSGEAGHAPAKAPGVAVACDCD